MSLQPLLLISVIVLVLCWYLKKKKPYVEVIGSLSPATTVFAFDLHSVVLIPRRLEIARLLWHNLLKDIPFSLIIKPKLWYHLYKLYRNSLASESIFTQLQQEYPAIAPLRNLIADLMAAYSVNPKMISILKTLKEEGYPLYILSNIWAESLEHLYRNFPILKELFDGAYIPSKDNNFAAKPSSVFYEGFKDYLAQQGHSNKHIIFVDNGENNLDQARKAGLYGVAFTSAESFIQFIEKHTQTSFKSF
jgi:FMN phosphatase YigB (HAD superfamily)